MRRGSAFGLKDEDMKSPWLYILVLLSLSTSVRVPSRKVKGYTSATVSLPA